MRFPWANSAILIFLLLQVISGYLGFTNGLADQAWFLWLHSIGAYGLIITFIWKASIILQVYNRKTSLSFRRIAFFALLFLLFTTLLTGLSWTFSGPIYILGFSLLTIHIFIAVSTSIIAIWHIWHYRWIRKVPRAVDRRTFLRTAGLLTGGLLLWRSTIVIRTLLEFPGSKRRFTGSYEIGSHTGNFPSVSWIADKPAPVDLNSWQLVIDGLVQHPLHLTYAQLLDLGQQELRVVLDCTGGWYSEQIWTGVRVGKLLQLVEPKARARSLTFKSITGYSRRFDLRQAQNFLLATHVAGLPLNHRHGSPIRLVAPGERGVNWVKWIDYIRVNETGPFWQTPLPLQ